MNSVSRHAILFCLVVCGISCKKSINSKFKGDLLLENITFKFLLRYLYNYNTTLVATDLPRELYIKLILKFYGMHLLLNGKRKSSSEQVGNVVKYFLT